MTLVKSKSTTEPLSGPLAPSGVSSSNTGASSSSTVDPEMVPVHIAWLRVRSDIGSIAKGELYNASGTRFNFRGVDTVVSAFGPVTLKHGVSVLPVRVDAVHRDTTSAKGNKLRECTVTVTWEVTGPMGDKLTLQSAGEALNTGDKGTAVAQSVALRVLLLTAGLTPTGDQDPDSVHHDRGEAPVRPLASYVEEIADVNTSTARLKQIYGELRLTNRIAELVTNEQGDDEEVGQMVIRMGHQRTGVEAGPALSQRSPVVGDE